MHTSEEVSEITECPLCRNTKLSKCGTVNGRPRYKCNSSNSWHKKPYYPSVPEKSNAITKAVRRRAKLFYENSYKNGNIDLPIRGQTNIFNKKYKYDISYGSLWKMFKEFKQRNELLYGYKNN